MKLRRSPTAPQPNPYRILENRAILDEWRPYIPWQSNGHRQNGEDAHAGESAGRGSRLVPIIPIIPTIPDGNNTGTDTGGNLF